jgi:hypothetical protein
MDYETLRQQHAHQQAVRLPEHRERLTWSQERVRAERSYTSQRSARHGTAHASCTSTLLVWQRLIWRPSHR